jgi:signal transduction histidine kinase
MIEEAISFFPIVGKVDREGRLIEADPPLAALHMQTGGRPGGTLAIPQLAALVRLVARLQAGVSRPVTAADDGTDIDLFVHARPDGEHVAIEITDWTTRPAQPNVRARSEGRVEDFQRAAADFFWTVDAELKLLDISHNAASALGATVAGLVGQSFTRLFGLFDSPDGSMPMLDSVAVQKAFEGQRARLRGTDFGLLMIEGAPIVDELGKYAGYRGSAVRMEEDEATSPIAVAALADDTFGAEIGKVLKAPLDRIIANADVISTQADGPLRRGYADYATDIASAGRHLMSLVDDLIELQAIEQPGYKPAREDIDLCDLARRAAGLLQVRAADSGVMIDRPGAGESLPAVGEFRRVLQILVNLIGNAVRHSPEGSKIWLRTEREGDHAVLIVADQGSGIDEIHHEKVFEKFERLHGAQSGASGLGLYISRQLARAMGGELTVDSALGQGARFILTLPAR